MPIALANWLENQRRFWEASLARLERFFLEPRTKAKGRASETKKLTQSHSLNSRSRTMTTQTIFRICASKARKMPWNFTSRRSAPLK